jgi:cysteinyl-tRNA synthetase
VGEKIRRLTGGAVLILALSMGLGNAAPRPANDFVYQLQRIDLRAIGETKFIEYWGPGGSSGLDRPTAEREMLRFVKSIAEYARVTHDHPGFEVFVQNAEGLSVHRDYVRTVSGIGKEDLFYKGNRRQSAAETSYSVRQLDRFKQAGKPVLVTDYVTQQAKIDAFYQKALSHGYVPYATRRDLDVLTINPGHAPD